MFSCSQQLSQLRLLVSYLGRTTYSLRHYAFFVMPPKRSNAVAKPKPKKGNSQRKAPVAKRAAQPARKHVTLYNALASAEGRPMARYLKEMTLPSESWALRWLATATDVPTNVFRYSLAHSETTIPKLADCPTIFLGAESVIGIPFIMSRQPSRILGYPARAAETTLLSFRKHETVPKLSNAAVERVTVSNNFEFSYMSSILADSISIGESTPFPTEKLEPILATTPSGPEHLAFSKATGETYFYMTGASSGQRGASPTSDLMVSFQVSARAITTGSATFAVRLVLYKYAPASEHIAHTELEAKILHTFTDAEVTNGTYVSKGVSVSHIPFTSGYYRLEATPIFSSGSIGNAPTMGLYVQHLRLAVSIAHSARAIRWRTTPEMTFRQDIYKQCRVNSVAWLFSNHTASYISAGTVRAVRFGNETAFHDCFDAQTVAGGLNADSSFYARAAQAPNGYHDNLKHGLYHWSRPSMEDMQLECYMSEHGSPIYHLEAKSPVTVAVFTASDAGSNTILPYAFAHLEAEISDAQSYGEQRNPTMSTRQFEALLLTAGNWPPFYDNPHHVVDMLKRIAGGAWKGFRYVSPYLARAATLAAGGATPGAVAQGIARLALGM